MLVHWVFDLERLRNWPQLAWFAGLRLKMPHLTRLDAWRHDDLELHDCPSIFVDFGTGSDGHRPIQPKVNGDSPGEPSPHPLFLQFLLLLLGLLVRWERCRRSSHASDQRGRSSGIASRTLALQDLHRTVLRRRCDRVYRGQGLGVHRLLSPRTSHPPIANAAPAGRQVLRESSLQCNPTSTCQLVAWPSTLLPCLQAVDEQ